VKAWVYSVLNPLTEALRAENTLLAKKNISWRYNTREMEFVLPTRDLVPPLARPNYDDLLRGYPKLRPSMEERDQKVEALARAASECWKHLTEYGILRQIVEGQRKQWKEESNPYPGGAVPEEDFWLLITEYVINNIEDLPYHYSSRDFWFRFRQNLLVLRVGLPFSQLEKTISELWKSNEILAKILDKERSNLCDQYDIPAAPI